MQIGKHKLENNLILAPMAGVTDRPFRQLCKALGVGMAVSEMVSSNSLLRGSQKTLRRANHDGETEPRSIQIAGADPFMMGEAARFNEAEGADIIDINMGCPAKKVCNTLAGSSLLRDEPLVTRILEATVNAVSIPVTLKIRTGWDPSHKNGITIAKIAEQSGIQALAVHGRTRSCFFKGAAEYETIAAIKDAVKIPVIANGDIEIMIGRAAQGRPWIFKEITHYLKTGELLPEPTPAEIKAILLGHLQNLYQFYGEYTGSMVARKHVSWYSRGQTGSARFRDYFNRLEKPHEQIEAIEAFFT